MNGSTLTWRNAMHVEAMVLAVTTVERTPAAV